MRAQLKNLAVPKVSLFVLATALAIVVSQNDPFWKAVLRATMTDEHRGEIILSLFVVLIFSWNILLSLAAFRYSLKPVVIALLLIASATGISGSPITYFIFHFLLFGVVPSIFVALIPLEYEKWQRAILASTLAIVLSVAVISGTLYLGQRDLSSFLAQNRDVRLLINPGYPIYSFIKYVAEPRGAGPIAGVRLAQDRTLARSEAEEYQESNVMWDEVLRGQRLDQSSNRGRPTSDGP